MGWPTALSLFVPGFPVQKGSMRPMPARGRCLCLPDNAAALKAWEKTVVAAARQALTVEGARPVPDGPAGVELHFWLHRPMTVDRFYPTKPPDVDKLTRAIFDALTKAKAIGDDAQFIDQRSSKRYALPGQEGVEVRVVAPESAPL